jgi:hypothetical protein
MECAMSSHDDEIALRKQVLTQRSAVQRMVLAVQVSQAVAPVVALADQARAGRQWVREHPALATWLAVAAGGALVAWRPRHGGRLGLLWRLVPQALRLHQVWQRVRAAQV